MGEIDRRKNKPEEWCEKLGWWKNPFRRDRWRRPGTVTDRFVRELLRKIDILPHYTKMLDPEVDRRLRMRDKAWISLLWTFLLRAGEGRKLRRRDIGWTDRVLTVRVVLEKKAKTFKRCLDCGESRNAKRARYCRRCGSQNLQTYRMGGRTEPTLKNRTLQYPFTRYIIEWVEELDRMGAGPDDFLFPPFIKGEFDLSRSITVQRMDQILAKLDPSMSTHMFRYGHAEKLFRLRYTIQEVKEIGGWESVEMPLKYAERVGETPGRRRWTEDIREL